MSNFNFIPRAWFQGALSVTTALSLVGALTACRNEVGGPSQGDLRVRESNFNPVAPPSTTPGNDTIPVAPNPDPNVGQEPGASEPDAPPEEPSMMESTKADLVWKRYRAVEQDLVQALSLQKSQLCNELGRYACVDKVHLAPLGGNEPFEQSQYIAVAEPTATTAIAFERTVLAGCSKRVDLDRSGTAVLFTQIDLDSASLDASNSATATAVNADATRLYRNLLQRNPDPEELEVLRGLASATDEGPISGSDFAKAACLAVGTSAEFLFF